MAFDADYDHVLTMQARRGRLDTAIEEMAEDCEFTPVVRRVSCLRGVSTLTGFALAVEIGDWNRFTGNTSVLRRVGALRIFVGFSRVQGAITKTGNTHVRRLLIEAAWHHRPRYVSGRRCESGGTWPPRPPGPAAMPATGGCTPVGRLRRRPQAIQ